MVEVVMVETIDKKMQSEEMVGTRWNGNLSGGRKRGRGGGKVGEEEEKEEEKEGGI